MVGIPLGAGALISFGIFGAPGSCASSTQILAIFLIPFISLPVDAGLIFAVWEFFHRKALRGLDSDRILHINYVITDGNQESRCARLWADGSGIAQVCPACQSKQSALGW